MTSVLVVTIEQIATGDAWYSTIAREIRNKDGSVHISLPVALRPQIDACVRKMYAFGPKSHVSDVCMTYV